MSKKIWYSNILLFFSKIINNNIGACIFRVYHTYSSKRDNFFKLKLRKKNLTSPPTAPVSRDYLKRPVLKYQKNYFPRLCSGQAWQEIQLAFYDCCYCLNGLHLP